MRNHSALYKCGGGVRCAPKQQPIVCIQVDHTQRAIATCRRRRPTASRETACVAKSRCGRHVPRTTSARRMSACTACPTGAQTWATSAVSTRAARWAAARRAESTPRSTRSGGARGGTRGEAGGWPVAWPRLPASWGAAERFRSVVGWACRGCLGRSAASPGSRASGPSARRARPSGASALGKHVVATHPG